MAYVDRPWKHVSLPVAETSRVPAALEICQHTVNIPSISVLREESLTPWLTVVVLVALELLVRDEGHTYRLCSWTVDMWLCHGQADQMQAYNIRTSALGGWFRREEGSVNPFKFGQLCGVVFYTAFIRKATQMAGAARSADRARLTASQARLPQGVNSGARASTICVDGLGSFFRVVGSNPTVDGFFNFTFSASAAG